MNKYELIRSDLERVRSRLDGGNQLDQHIQLMLDAVAETILLVEYARKPCEIIAFDQNRRRKL